MSLFSGEVLLASKNLFPNPRFRDFRPDRTLDQWDELLAPVTPDGWNVYCKPPGGIVHGRQNITPLPMGQASYTQNEETIDGAPAPLPGASAPIAAPSRPSIMIISRTVGGFGVGWYGVAGAWCCHSLEAPDRRFTAVSRRATVSLLTGNRVAPDLPVEAPEKVLGYALFMTPAQASQADALTAPLYLQKVIPAIGGRFPETYELNGPWRDGEIGNDVNGTFVGAYQGFAPPSIVFEPSPFKLRTMNLQASWSFMTDFGWSASQGVYPGPDNNLNFTQRIAGGDLKVIAVRPPFRPPGAKMWRAEVKGIVAGGDGYWYSYEYKGGDWEGLEFGERALIWSADPDDLAEFEKTQYALERVDRRKEDHSGIESPEIEPPGVEAFSGTGVTVGRHEVLCTYTASEFESGPSGIAAVEVGSSTTWRIFRPPDGNVLPNPEANEYEVGAPTLRIQDWTELTGAGYAWSFGSGEFTLDDTTGASVAANVLSSRTLDWVEGMPFVFRCRLNVTRRAGGQVRIVVRQIDAASGITDQSVATRSSVGITEVEAAFGPGGFTLEPDTVNIKVIVVDEGTTRDLTWTLDLMGLWAGTIAPRKRSLSVIGAAPAENPADAYFHGGYCVVVEDPPDSERPGALAGLPLNMIEYYGSFGVTNSDGLFARGLRMPVRPGEVMTLSFWAQALGISEPVELLDSAYKDKDGLTVFEGHNGPAATISSSTAWVRYERTYTAPEGAAYIEFNRSSVGQGRVRLIAPQWEVGVDATSFDWHYSSAGSLEVLLDTHAPDVPENDRLSFVNQVKRLAGSGFVADEPEGTLVTLSYKSSNDPEDLGAIWYPSFEDVPFGRYINILAEMETDDTDVTPRLKQLYVDYERHEATLLRHDGTEYPGGTILRAVEVAASQQDFELIEYADNSDGFSETGNPRNVLDSVTAECYREAAASEIKGNIGKAETDSAFTIELPSMDPDGPTMRLVVQTFERPRATNMSPRRPGERVRVQALGLSKLKVLGSEPV